MNALVTFRDDGAHTKQQRTFGGPVTRGTGTVFFAREDHERDVFRNVFLRSFEDAHLRAVGQVTRESALKIGNHFVAQAHVGETCRAP